MERKKLKLEESWLKEDAFNRTKRRRGVWTLKNRVIPVTSVADNSGQKLDMMMNGTSHSAFLYHIFSKYSLGRPHSRGEGGFVQCGHFANKGGFFRCGRLHFLMQKNFSKFMACPHGQGGRFSRFCADVLYGRLLSILNLII